MEYKKLTNKSSEFPVIVGVIILCFALAFGTAVYGLLKISKLENDLADLKIRHNKLHEDFKSTGISYDGLFDSDDDSNFEYQLDDVSLKDYDDYYQDGDYKQHLLNADDWDDESEEKLNKSKKLELPVNDYHYEVSSEKNTLLNGGYFTKVGLEEKRHKRDVVATTVDGVLVNSESYADAKNKTAGKGVLKLYPRLIPKSGESPRNQGLKHYEDLNKKSTVAPGPIIARRSRVMHVEDKSKAFRRIVKRPKLKSADRTYQEHSATPEVHRRRRHRQRRVESYGDVAYIKLRPTIHLNGDVSQSAFGVHDNFEGNGRLHHYDRHFINWTSDDWVQNLGMDQYFQLTDGKLTILESGVYMIYAQIYYNDEHDTNGFRVYKNEKMILQCTTTTHTNHRINKPNTCYTAGVEYITEGDVLRVHDVEANRYSIFEPGKSFFGVLKLGDAKIK